MFELEHGEASLQGLEVLEGDPGWGGMSLSWQQNLMAEVVLFALL